MARETVETFICDRCGTKKKVDTVGRDPPGYISFGPMIDKFNLHVGMDSTCHNDEHAELCELCITELQSWWGAGR